MQKLPSVRQLQYFVTLDELGHFGRAAEHLGGCGIDRLDHFEKLLFGGNQIVLLLVQKGEAFFKFGGPGEIAGISIPSGNISFSLSRSDLNL